MKLENFFEEERWEKIGKGIWIASQYGLSIVVISICDYLLGLDWGASGAFVSVLVPLIINTIRQLVKDNQKPQNAT